MNFGSGEVWSGSRSVTLTAQELKVLELFVTSESGVTREAVIDAAGLNGDAHAGDAAVSLVAADPSQDGMAGPTRRTGAVGARSDPRLTPAPPGRI